MALWWEASSVRKCIFLIFWKFYLQPQESWLSFVWWIILQKRNSISITWKLHVLFTIPFNRRLGSGSTLYFDINRHKSKICYCCYIFPKITDFQFVFLLYCKMQDKNYWSRQLNHSLKYSERYDNPFSSETSLRVK